MGSIVDELNRLLARERGEAEAVKTLIEELEDSDPDIADSASDVFQTSSWSCSGLYHRITQLDATPTLEETNLAEELEDEPDARSKLELLCSSQAKDLEAIRLLLNRPDVDETTRGFLKDLLKAHEDTTRWCKTTLGEWVRDI